MAVAGQQVDESLPCIGLAPGEALDRVLRAVASDGSYRTVQVAPDRVQFARTFRPTWAIVAGVATIWIALLGFLFFFVSTTETCVATVESDHAGTRIRLHGRLTAATLGQIRAALRADQAGAASSAPGIGTPVPAAPVPAAQVSAAPVSLPASVVAEAPVAVAPAPVIPVPPVATPVPLLVPPPAPSATQLSPTPASPAVPNPAQPAPSNADPGEDHTIVVSRTVTGVSIRLDDGRVIALTDSLVIGRDPEGPDAVAVDDPGRSVSKTHVGLSLRGGRVGVTDLHSTNGVRVDRGDGTSEQLVVGVEVTIGDGTVVHYGDRNLVVSVPVFGGAL